MKKINLRGLSEVLSEKELKNVLGGSGDMGDCIWSSCFWDNHSEEGCCWEGMVQCVINARTRYLPDDERGAFKYCIFVVE